MHVSSCFVNADRSGYDEERMNSGDVDWIQEYEKCLTLSKRDVKAAGILNIIRSLPDMYTYTKRMAEHVLFNYNEKGKKVPLAFVRPSIMAASLSEPVPGWTDSMNLLSGATMAVGLGVMRDVPGNPESFFDCIPVDIVSKQLLASVPFTVDRAK